MSATGESRVVDADESGERMTNQKSNKTATSYFRTIIVRITL